MTSNEYLILNSTIESIAQKTNKVAGYDDAATATELSSRLNTANIIATQIDNLLDDLMGTNKVFAPYCEIVNKTLYLTFVAGKDVSLKEFSISIKGQSINGQTVTQKETSFDLTNYSDLNTTYEISVTATTTTNKTSSQTTITYIPQLLPPTIYVEGNVLHVINNPKSIVPSQYYLTVVGDNDNKLVDDLAVDRVPTDVYDLTQLLLQEGDYRVTIKAYAQDQTSNESNSVEWVYG